MSIWLLLERARHAHPDAIAVVDAGGIATYAQVHRRALGLAAFGYAHTIRAGDRIAILAWNSGAYLETYFAAAALGAILTPLNVRLSALELAEILRDSGARWMIADSEFGGLVIELARSGTVLEGVIWVGDMEHAAERADVECSSFADAVSFSPKEFAPASVDAETVAHVYYTSGTTGVPKGVMLTHGNVCAHAQGAVEELALSGRDAWAHIAPMFHLADAWATFAITQVGGRHVFLRRFDAETALDLVERERITITNLVPTMLNAMVNHPRARVTEGTGDGGSNDESTRGTHVRGESASVCSERHRTSGVAESRDRERPRDWSSLRMLLSGGAPIAPEVVRAVIATFGCEYVQTYGMTETSPYLTLSLLREHLKTLPTEEQLTYKCKTGRPFTTIELKVVDETGLEVAGDEKTVGEIWVRGPTVTPGYWNRPEETRRAFHDSWLKTGDLAVIDAEGYVTIVDRKKDMIITGGEKVYSIEVEHALHTHPAVLECAVFGVPDEVWGESVRAAVVLKPGTLADDAALRDHCRARLAAYKIPRTIEFLRELPRTGSGKISKWMLVGSSSPMQTPSSRRE